MPEISGAIWCHQLISAFRRPDLLTPHRTSSLATSSRRERLVEPPGDISPSKHDQDDETLIFLVLEADHLKQQSIEQKQSFSMVQSTTRFVFVHNLRWTPTPVLSPF